MTDQSTSPPKPGSPHGAMDPPATPGPGRSARDPTSTPAPAPSTPGRRNRTLLPSTPCASNSPFPARAPRTPGGSSLTLCTVDESQYSRVTVHTAKCTECDKRNMDTMRRCPGCTFQVCQPCYEKRLKQDKGLLHGNMATPGATGGGLSTSSGGRAVRKKPLPSTEKQVDKVEDEEEESIPAKEEAVIATPKSSAKKRAMKKKAPVVETEAEESSEDEFEPDDTSPTPSKRRRTGRRRSELTFAESALATALRTPPATRATKKSLPAPSSPGSDPVNTGTSVGYRSSGFLGSDFEGDKDLYDVGIKPYKNEPLLARQEPVVSNPASRIPDIIKRGGQPRAENQTYNNIQVRVRAKLQQSQTHETDQDEAVAPTVEQSKKAEQDADPQTVGAFVEKEAARYQNDETMDEDENEAIFNAMKSAALVWGKQTYKKLDSEMQLMVQPGLKLRLDLIDEMFREELAKLMDEHADHILSELGVGVKKPVAAPAGQLFKPA